MNEYDHTFNPNILIGHYDLISWFSDFALYLNTEWVYSGIFSAILGRGPRAFLIGKISDIHPEFGKFSKHSKLMIFSNLT